MKAELTDRDRLWCRAIIEQLDTNGIYDVIHRFNELRPDETPKGRKAVRLMLDEEDKPDPSDYF